MKALVIAPTPYYIEKGSSLRVHSMVDRLQEQGYSVDILCYNKGADPEADDLRIKRSGIKAITKTDAGPSFSDFLNDVFLGAAALRMVQSNEYDIIQGEDVEGIVIALLASQFTDCEVVYDIHNPLTENLKINDIIVPEKISRHVEGILYHAADRLLSNWDQWTQDIKKRYGITHIETVYDQLPGNKREMNLPTDTYITYVGNFKKYQGVNLLVEGFENISNQVSVDLILVGEPSTDIERLVHNSPATDQIHLVGRQNIEVSNYIIANSVACVIPRRDGDQPSTKLLHYTMHDVPIIATNLDCNRELERFENTILWADLTPESIGNQILRVDQQHTTHGRRNQWTIPNNQRHLLSPYRSRQPIQVLAKRTL